MGRRKIEIQPIAHERNRSVTFLKRKNGLFKKAYELGVLCSVDVAVIVFEERPGHHVKLFQYCSTDVQGMIQRHLRHDGEKDTRGPADFAPGGSAKTEEVDVDNGDDDDGDDNDGAPLSVHGQKRRNDGLQLDPDYIPPRSATSHSFPPNPAASMIQRQQNFPPRSGQQMPHRPYEPDHRQLHLTRDPKRARLGMEPTSSASLGPYSSSQFRIPGPPASLSHSGHGSPIHTQQPSFQDYGQFSTSQNFGSMHSPSSDRSTGIGDRGLTVPRTIYGNVGPASAGSGGFLEGDGRRRSGTSPSTLGASLEWPTSKPGSSLLSPERERREMEREKHIERTTSGSSGGSNPSPNTAGPGGGPDWLDFLSGNGNATSSSGVPAKSPGGVSWDRNVSSRTRNVGDGTAPGNGQGEMDPMSLFGLNSDEMKKEG